jgi:DNA repair protein RadC
VERRIPLYKLKLHRERWAICPEPSLGHPLVSALFFHRLIGRADREHSAALYFDVKGTPVGASILGIGSLTATEMPGREVYKAALLANAHHVVVAHNHPSSGQVSPSHADLRTTRSLVRAGWLLGIELFDHLIVGPDGTFVSLRELGGVFEADKANPQSRNLPTP